MVSCSGNTNPMKESNTNLTQGNVQLNLQVGKTSKAQVLEVFGAGWVHRSGSVCTPRWKTTSTRGVGGVGNDSICATRLFSTSSANPLRIAKVVRRSFSSAPSSAEELALQFARAFKQLLRLIKPAIRLDKGGNVIQAIKLIPTSKRVV